MQINLAISINVPCCCTVIDPIYDGVNVMYTLRRPAMSTLWTNAVLKVRRNQDDATAFVFFDGDAVNDTITLNSLISTSSNTTPGATTLGTWAGANKVNVEQWIGITDDNTIDANKTASQTTLASQPNILNASGVIVTKDGFPYINFSSATEYLSASANTALAQANDFTVITNSFSFSNSNVQSILSTADTANDRFEMFNDRTVNNRIALIRSTAATNYITTLLTRDDSNALRVQTVVKEGTNLTGYLDDVEQNPVVWAGNYTNDILVLGAGQNKNSPLQGGILEIVIFPDAI